MASLESTKIEPQSRFIGGISDYDKDASPESYAFGQSVDVRSNSREVKILPKTVKESGSNILGLPKWADRVSDDVFMYDEVGRIYKRTSAASYSVERTVANSHGNGLKYYGEDGFMYYTSDKLIGRYGPTSGVGAMWVDDFLVRRVAFLPIPIL